MHKVDPVTFTKEVLELTTASWVDAEEFERFSRMVGTPEGASKVDFFQRFIALLKRLPDVLVDKEKKDKIVEAAQEYLDRAIEEEEDLEEEM